MSNSIFPEQEDKVFKEIMKRAMITESGDAMMVNKQAYDDMKNEILAWRGIFNDLKELMGDDLTVTVPKKADI